MDLSKFSDSEFEVKEWVNGALRAHKDTQTPLDAHASTLVMKLQLFIQEVNNALEDTSSQMVQSLPRVLRDIEAVRQEATLLKEQMQIVKEDIKRVESETAESMQTLVELDAVKQRMLESQRALKEADNWTTLLTDVEEVFASQDINKIAEKLAGMQQSLDVLHDVPDFEERKRLLSELKNRLEALLSPRLISAFQTHSLPEAQRYVVIFKDINRYPQLKNYYIGCHKYVIEQLWTSLHSPDKPLLDYLSSFYDELLSKWHSEFSWASQVFPDPLGMLSCVFSEGVESLHPPLAQCLSVAIQAAPQPLTTLLQLREMALRFVKGLERAVSGCGQSLEGVYLLVESVHSPYCQLLVKYPSMETQLLRRQLHSVQLDTLVGVEEGVSVIADSVVKVFTFASEAVDRCLKLTEGWGLTALIKAIKEGLFSQYLSKLSSCMHQLRRVSGLEASGRGLEAGGRGDEWTLLSHAFRLIQCCGEMLLHLDSLNSRLCSAAVNCSSSLMAPASDSAPFGCYDYLSIYHPEEHTAMTELLAAVEKGGGECDLFVSLTNQIQSLNEQAHTFAFDILFSQLKQKLSKVPHLKVWETGVASPLESPRALTDDLPSFSLSPLPYITEIGDYLLTMPQQLEPFTSQDNPALSHALKHGRLPFLEGQVLSMVDEAEGHPSDRWLAAIAEGTMATYTDNILLIPSLPPPAAHQLITDIAYLCNVLAALGQSPSEQLSQLESLMKADQPQFLEYREDKSVSGQLYQSVARIRTWH